MPATAVGTYTLQTALDVNGTLRLNAGTLDVSAGNDYQINVGGNWENFGGVFAARSGTVVLDGADQEIPASETFYSLDKTLSAGPARTLTVGQQSTLTVAGTLTLDGFNGSNRLNIRSSTTGTRFTVDVTGAEQNVGFVNVRDSQASSNNIVTGNSVDAGNTDRPEAEPHWIFGPLRGAVIIVD